MFSVILSYKQSVVFQNRKRSRTVTLYLNQLVTSRDFTSLKLQSEKYESRDDRIDCLAWKTQMNPPFFHDIS